MLLSTLAINADILRHETVSPWLLNILYPVGARIVLPFYFRKISIIGEENIPRTGPVIVAPTHRSRWDALIIPFACGRRASGRDPRFMVTASEVQGVQGWFIRRLGGFAIDLKRPEYSSLRYSIALLQAGEMLVIFPEGGIFHDRQVHPLKRGVGRIALEVEAHSSGSKVCVLPVSLHYTPAYPTWRTEVEVRIGKPIYAQDYPLKTLKTSSAKLTEDLAASLKNLHEDELLADTKAAENTV